MGEGDDTKKQQGEGNVIRFPVEKVKQKNRLKKLAGKVSDHRKTTLFLSLLSVVVVSIYVLRHNTSPERYVASTGSEETLSLYQGFDWRTPASFGRRPSSEEILREQVLNRSYALKFDGEGRVLEILYVPSDEGSQILSRPIYLDPEKFLNDYRDIIAPGYDRVTAEGDRFALLLNNRTVGYATFEFTEGRTLHSMKVEFQR
jgi:hypothetical protein